MTGPRSIHTSISPQNLLGDLFIPPDRLKKAQKLGEGAFATVYKATLYDDASMQGQGRPVAVKALKQEVKWH